MLFWMSFWFPPISVETMVGRIAEPLVVRADTVSGKESDEGPSVVVGPLGSCYVD